MASAASSSSGQGALFELVARGVKDAYFMKDDRASVHPYDPRYDPSTPHLAERRTTIPINRTLFGGTFEVELEAYGDVLTECSLEIELPTWLPPLPLTTGTQPVDPSIANGLYSVVGSDGTSYGYVNGVGYFLFESIQFYQDQHMIQEWSGDGLFARQMTQDTHTHAFLALSRAGYTATAQDAARAIALRATPSSLRVDLPLPGLQGSYGALDCGFPLVALPHQTFRFKITLRRLEDLVVCSDELTVKPAPWNVAAFHYTDRDGNLHTVPPRSLLDIGHPRVTLATVQRYVTVDMQRHLQTMQIPYRKWFENRFTFGELDYIMIDKGGVSAVTRRLEGRHPAERLLWFFRQSTATDRNRLDDFTNPNELADRTFYNTMKFVIAGRDRELPQPSMLWNTVGPHAKDDRGSVGTGIGAIRWSISNDFRTSVRQMEGTVNFSTADRPTLYLELANVASNPRIAQRLVEFRVWIESWNVYEIQNGRGRPMFAN